MIVRDVSLNAELFSLSGVASGAGLRNWTVSGDRLVTPLNNRSFRIWNGLDGAELLDVTFKDNKERRWLWSADGFQFATIGDDGIQVLDGRPIPPG